MTSTPSQRMIVILTHEHTDFDALASMLAAARLHPGSTPVLPRRLNRNVETFLADYRDMLPFVRQDDLPGGRIDQVIAVDAQTVQPVRGMSKQATGLIIDHHPLARELPTGWTYWGEETGATVTLLVERIADQGLTVSPIEATLLALGIYEDTGGLSYTTTTPRDLRAAAWLLEGGANLLVIGRFLHHPLTDEQSRLYQQLVDNAHPHQFHGNSVIIACASVPEPVEEISTLSHKLHDLFEPDALFMLVQMGDVIQVVARSTSDAVDVGRIAAALGGGGHGRAAAAHLRNESLASAFESLVNLLQAQIQPAITVGQIMSHGAPQVLDPADTIAIAAERTRRYGFEGFPVVEDGRIVGMLTRREIDRAVHHGLEAHPISRYMRAGEVYVTPADSVAKLREVMAKHDWGQVPVLDPDTGALLGIVTRTDLIQQWPAAAPLRAEGVGDLMAAALPAPLLDLLRQAGAMAADLGCPVYAVGGFVRDLLLDQPNFDVDLVVEGDAIRLAQRLAEQLGGRVRSHRRFGTAKWILPQQHGERAEDGIPSLASLDFVTARAEFYEHPTALPTVERSSIKQDLHRRDFTINTLAVRLTPDRWGELIDPFGGRNDLEGGVIRVLHSLSFVEDPTRILRAVRFEQRFSFRIEARTEELIADASDLLERVSGERVRHELELVLAEAEPERVLCRLDELQVLARLNPHLHCDDWVVTKAQELRSVLAMVRDPGSRSPAAMALAPDAAPRLHLALFTHRLPGDALAEFLDRFRIRKEHRALASEVHRLAGQLKTLGKSDLRPSEIVGALDGSSEETRLLLRIVSDGWLVRQRLDAYQLRLRHVHPGLTGDDLRRMGIPPGRLYRQILARLRALRLDGEIATAAEEEAAALAIFRGGAADVQRGAG